MTFAAPQSSISKAAVLSQSSQSSSTSMASLADFSIGNAQLTVQFDGLGGFIKSVHTLDPTTGRVIAIVQLTQNFYTLRSKMRDFANNKVSGAYRLSPINEEPRMAANRTTYKVISHDQFSIHHN